MTELSEARSAGSAGGTEQIPEKLTRDELRELFLFEKLDDAQLDWLAHHGDVVDGLGRRDGLPRGRSRRAASGCCSPARWRCCRRCAATRSRPRARASAAPTAARRRPTSRTPSRPTCTRCGRTQDATFLALPATEWAEALREWFPLPIHLLEGLVVGMRRTSTITSERERLLALGSLSAGLTHELNNPAAAAQRATESLRSRVAGMRHKLGDAGLRQARRRDDRPARRPAGGRRQPGRDRPGPLGDGGLGRRGRARRLARPAQRRRRLGPRRRSWSRAAWTPSGWTRSSARCPRGRSRPRCAGSPTPSRPRR